MGEACAQRIGDEHYRLEGKTITKAKQIFQNVAFIFVLFE